MDVVQVLSLSPMRSLLPDGQRICTQPETKQAAHAPVKRAKLCTYFAWFLRPSQLKTVPYFETPMPISRLRLLMHFRMGSHALLVEQGRKKERNSLIPGSQLG